jgi:arginyl-tRNA--protein-N-Asp/Glu arginylyltransferase
MEVDTVKENLGIPEEPKNIKRPEPKPKALRPTKPECKANTTAESKVSQLVRDAEEGEKQKHQLKVVTEQASFSQESFKLYCKYQVAVHGDKEEDLSGKGFKRCIC